ncbi:haloacid dehalogenase-like hydrolase [Skeletonema marinoi]|uniref:Haloacid dehalogenase-like hydrolase n=1 Tax=Skeletonema marinoi TaxID=267567 RepID=A0AAD8Y5T0_9STRA|nr:haloacid dehalogenase-like hydrolase [Skeletonema marinoi]
MTPLQMSSTGDDENYFTSDEDQQQQRRRKRDILKRTLGIGSTGGSSSGDGNEPVVRLDTNDLFKGMPSIDSILGAPPPSQPYGDMTPSQQQQDEPQLRKEGRMPEVDFLSPQDVESLNDKYSNIDYRFTDDTTSTNENTYINEEGQETQAVSQEETKKIIDYTIEEEKLMERRKLNEQRKREMLEQWERDSKQKEDERVNEITASSNGSDNNDDFLERDGVAREILADAQSKEDARVQFNQQQVDLTEYERTTFEMKMAEAVDKFDDATTPTWILMNCPKSLGVLANSIPLEDARAFLRKQKKEKEFLKEVEDLAAVEGVQSDEDVEAFFRRPVDYNEERMYRGIIRQIVDKRAVEEDVIVPVFDNVVKRMMMMSMKLVQWWYKLKKKSIHSLPKRRFEETRRKEKEQLTKVLKKGLESDDAVEISSNELLMKELLEGGITKERSIRLLDKLIAKTTVDTIRDSLVELKTTIMEEDEMDQPNNVGEKKKKKSGPIDLSGVFRTSDDLLDTEPSAAIATPAKPMEEVGGRTLPSWMKEQAKENAVPTASDAPFSSSYSPTGGMFGTYEEQKFERLAGQVGAQSEEEKEELRRNMEALKQAEEMATAELLNDEIDIAAVSAKLGINIDDLNLDAEDDQIMSILGKRPVRGSSDAEGDGEIKQASLTLMKPRKAKTVDITDDIFRSKTAGKYQDKETRDKDEAAFRDLVKMEAEAESRLESMPDETVSTDFDIDEFADDILSEMKPRPRVNRREDFMSQEQIQRERKQESIFGDDPFPINEQEGKRAPPSSDDTMPAWFRKEQEDYGVQVDDDSGEDTFDEAQWEWEKEERQKKADEYLKKRGEGISISDVLGREYFGPMDDEDDYEKERISAFSSFQARKDELLTYEELTVEDINNVIDFKEDPSETGYNPYLSKVQRPFSEYGAIFRLEGVLVDLIGLHAKAWQKVAKTHGYEISSPDEVRQASLYKPADAVREVFFWTEDMFEWEAIAETHKAAFNEAFDNWLESKSVVNASEDDYVADTFPAENDRAMPSDAEMSSMYNLAWSKLAVELNRTAPTADEVNRGILGQDWEVAVKDIFGWSEDPEEVYDIVVAYDKILQADYKTMLAKYGIDLDRVNEEDEQSLFGLNFPDVSMKEGVKDWLNTIREVEMSCALVSHLDSDQLDVILEATGLAEYFPPERRVSSDAKYSARSEYLGGALRAEQRPEECIVFDNTPISATIAHDLMMKNIAFVDHYAKYELLTADVSFGYVSDLDLMDIAKIFEGTREDNEPMLELDLSSGLQKQQRKVRTAFWDE